jgi:hypothetical protein
LPKLDKINSDSNQRVDPDAWKAGEALGDSDLNISLDRVARCDKRGFIQLLLCEHF